MRRVALVLAYEGTSYYGFSAQPGLPTVQASLERSLRACLGHAVRVTPAGRTDRGVHASHQVVSFDTSATLAPEVIVKATNARLPCDIRAIAAQLVAEDFDARKSCRWREYRYLIWNYPTGNLCWRKYCHHVPEPLDVASMQRAAQLLEGRHDFSAFYTLSSQDEPYPRQGYREVLRAAWKKCGPFLVFQITAQSFLRRMVRSLVGTLVLVGNGRLSVAEVEKILLGRDRRRAGPSAPARGLMLCGALYGEGATTLPTVARWEEALAPWFAPG